MGKDRIYFSYLNFWKTDYSEPNKVLLLSILAISRTEFNLMRYHMFPPVPLEDMHVQLFHIQTENRTEKRKSFPFLQILLILKMPLLMTMAVISQKNFKNLGGACPCTCVSSTAHAWPQVSVGRPGPPTGSRLSHGLKESLFLLAPVWGGEVPAHCRSGKGNENINLFPFHQHRKMHEIES